MGKFLSTLSCLMLFCLTGISADDKLTGTVIGTKDCVDYSTNRKTTTVNTCANAFDSDLNTFFASWDRNYTWAGLDLGSPHVITRVGWSPRNDGLGEERVVLGVFEGSNSPDFMDALPLYLIVAELEFYGHEGQGDDTHLYQVTNLPTVSIHTKDGVIPYDKEHEIASHFTIISDNGTRILSEPGSTRERGNASRSFPKKPYRIKFDKKQLVLNAPGKAKKWTLINNYGDKTLMRNLLAFELSRRLGMPYTPYGAAVDVLLNGEYKGCYQLCDQVQVHPHRVNITEMTPFDIYGSALSGGYFIEIDAYANQEKSWFNSAKNNPVTIKSPDEDSITTQQKSYIRNYFNTMESQWETYLDKNTFLRHFLVGELSGNTDTYWSVFMYKERDDDLMYTGPVWDFDLAFDNDQRTYPVCSKNDYVYRSGGSCAGNMRSFVDKIVILNAAAKAQMLDIWDEARQSGLTEENLVAWIDEMEAELQQSQRLNFMRWDVMNRLVHQNVKLWGSYTAEVQNVRRFMKERLAWMDKKLQYTYVPNAIVELDVDLSLPYQVFSLSGLYCGHRLDGLRPGVYVVRQGQSARKMVVR